MSKSYIYLEKEYLSKFRDEINKSENITDVREVLLRTVRALLSKVLPSLTNNLLEEVEITFENTDSPLKFGKEIQDILKEEIKNSDLLSILDKFVDSAMNRYKHFKKYDENYKEDRRI